MTVERQAAQGAAASGSQRLSLRGRSDDGRDPFRRAVRLVNSTTGVDLKTGRPIVNPDKSTRSSAPSCMTSARPHPGAKDWNPSAYSPRTGLMYIPHENLCMDWEDVQANYIAGTPYVGANVVMKAGPGGNRGEFTAWDPVQAKAAWTIKEDLPLWSGALATAGDLVFYGTMDGWFKAVDAKTGELKWQFKTGSGIIGQPIAYRGPGRPRICRHPVGRRRLGRCHRQRRPRPARQDRGARLRRRRAGSQAEDRSREGRSMSSLCRSRKRGLRCGSGSAARWPPAASFAQEPAGVIDERPRNSSPTSTLFPGRRRAAAGGPERQDSIEGNPQAIADGERLFDWYNCSGCHFHGGGGMGPALMDQQWIYGGALDQIYASIVQGRPNGMPSWGRKDPGRADLGNRRLCEVAVRARMPPTAPTRPCRHRRRQPTSRSQ